MSIRLVCDQCGGNAEDLYEIRPIVVSSPAHLPDGDDTVWGAADEEAWLWDDDVQRRRADR